MASCPSCRRPVALARATCLYCGAALPPGSVSVGGAGLRLAPGGRGARGSGGWWFSISPACPRKRSRGRSTCRPTRPGSSSSGADSTCSASSRAPRPRPRRGGSRRRASSSFSCPRPRPASARCGRWGASATRGFSPCAPGEGPVTLRRGGRAAGRAGSDHAGVPAGLEAAPRRHRAARRGLPRAPAPAPGSAGGGDRRLRLRVRLRGHGFRAARARRLGRGGRARRDGRRRLPPPSTGAGSGRAGARGALGAAGSLRLATRSRRGREEGPIVLDNVEQFRFYSGWRAAVERRR